MKTARKTKGAAAKPLGQYTDAELNQAIQTNLTGANSFAKVKLAGDLIAERDRRMRARIARPNEL